MIKRGWPIQPHFAKVVPVYASGPGIIINSSSVHFQKFTGLSLISEERWKDVKWVKGRGPLPRQEIRRPWPKAVVTVTERSKQPPLPLLLETAHPLPWEEFLLSLWEMSLRDCKLGPSLSPSQGGEQVAHEPMERSPLEPGPLSSMVRREKRGGSLEIVRPGSRAWTIPTSSSCYRLPRWRSPYGVWVPSSVFLSFSEFPHSLPVNVSLV